MDLRIIDEFYGRIFAKHHGLCDRHRIIFGCHLVALTCAVGDANVQTLTIRCSDLRRWVETDTKPALPLAAQILLETAQRLLGEDQPVAKEAVAAERGSNEAYSIHSD
ncbi:hypothetical protein XH88_36115 [Bradyrhizobium sp. CCBAU 51627]|nr:hypothetical protein [Bradyrhizobium sp. CCBAU 51627]